MLAEISGHWTDALNDYEAGASSAANGLPPSGGCGPVSDVSNQSMADIIGTRGASAVAAESKHTFLSVSPLLPGLAVR